MDMDNKTLIILYMPLIMNSVLSIAPLEWHVLIHFQI